jgi:hypothetical protein
MVAKPEKGRQVEAMLCQETQPSLLTVLVSVITDPESKRIRIPDPIFSIRDPGSKRFRIPAGGGHALPGNPALSPHSSYQCYGSGIFIPDSESDVFHPGSRVKKIPDSHQRI